MATSALFCVTASLSNLLSMLVLSLSIWTRESVVLLHVDHGEWSITRRLEYKVEYNYIAFLLVISGVMEGQRT